MTDSERVPTRDAILKAIDRCRPEDFDGHTDWAKLDFEKKLLWLSRSARLVLQQAHASTNTPRAR